MKKLTYERVSELITMHLQKSGRYQVPVKFSISESEDDVGLAAKGLIDAINESMEPDTETGYEWEDPSCDLTASIHQIQELLDQKL